MQFHFRVPTVSAVAGIAIANAANATNSAIVAVAHATAASARPDTGLLRAHRRRPRGGNPSTGRRLVSTAVTAILLACGRDAEPPPYTIIFDFAGGATLPAATLDTIAQAMAAVWHVHLEGAPQRVRVRIQEPPLSHYQPSSLPALYIPCGERRNCVEMFAIGLEGARLLRAAMQAPASEPEWLAYIMAHEAVHLGQQARGDTLEGSVADWRYGAHPIEREAFREAARFAGARRIVLTGSDDGTVTICPAGMPRRDCSYRREEVNPYVAALEDVRYRFIAD